MRKRLLSLALALTLVCTVTVPAHAVTVTEVVPCSLEYRWVYPFSEGLALVYIYIGDDLKFGFIDKTGKEVVPCKYDNAESFSEGFAVVRIGDSSNGKWGLIDKTGKEVVPCEYSYEEALAIRNRYIGKTEQTISDSEQASLERLKALLPAGKGISRDEDGIYISEDTVIVDQEGKYGFVDLNGKEIAPCIYDEVGSFSEGLAAVVRQDRGVGFIDKTGAEVIPLKYHWADSFFNGLAPVRLDGKLGFVDKTGKEVIPCKYDYGSAWGFSDGFLQVKIGDKYGFVDKTGREVVPCKYDGASSFSDGLAPVKLNDKWGFLAIDGYNTAYASTQSVQVDGKAVTFQCYALKDANGNDTNYIKLRDVASVLNGTAVQFNVGWDGAVNIETGKGYTPNGSEMKTPFSGNRAYETATAETRINGSRAALDAIVLKDDAGGAYTYYKLRDLGAALGFRVDWSAEKGIFIETK